MCIRDRAEIDRFCDAMLSILAEARAVSDGTWPVDNNPLVNAPHTAASVIIGEWDRPYSRSRAVYPMLDESDATDPIALGLKAPAKYWPPVGRIDGPYGDRNLVCSCPPLDEYL